jgi:Tfp pilus assembly protein PilN
MPSPINLIPAHRIAARQRRARLRAWGSAVVAYGIALAIACTAVTVLQADPEAGQTLQQVELTRAANRKASGTLVEAAKRLALAQTSQKMVRVLSDQPDWSLLFAGLGNRLGDDAVLRDIRLRSISTGPAGPPRYKLELRGLGKTQTAVSQFVAALEKSELFDEVRLLRTGREPFLTDNAVSFDLDCTLGDGGGRK